jgi:hypothetical protein
MGVLNFMIIRSITFGIRFYSSGALSLNPLPFCLEVKKSQPDNKTIIRIKIM